MVDDKRDDLDWLDSPIVKCMDGEGITLGWLIKKLKEEMEADETKVFNDKGNILYSKGMTAWEIRQKARIDAHKLRGDYPAEEHKISGEMITKRSPEELKELREIAKEVVRKKREKK